MSLTRPLRGLALVLAVLLLGAAPSVAQARQPPPILDISSVSMFHRWVANWRADETQVLFVRGDCCQHALQTFTELATRYSAHLNFVHYFIVDVARVPELGEIYPVDTWRYGAFRSGPHPSPFTSDVSLMKETMRDLHQAGWGLPPGPITCHHGVCTEGARVGARVEDLI
jgi:hypothetical protein